ncbi:PucR family transcriptional regulator ligand-binding domain-containing protein [Propionibacterium freudenreichii]|uniref:Translation regulator n=2 Tax=Propionibacterium TaxID=1743 RepID=A0A2C7AHJ8_9ACTN
MAITVRDLLAAPELRLVLREPGGEGALDRAVRWIHQSELPDSTGFTEPGEVLITTGAVLPQGAEADSDHGRRLYADYVQRLRDTSVVALGFSLGPQHETVPGSLLTAAHQAGLPLFEIPWAIPFSAVVKAVSQAQASAEQANLLRTNRAQRRLIGAVGRADAAHALVSTTAQIIDGWSALTDTSGHVITRAGAVPLERLAELATVHQGAGRASSFATGAMVQNIDGVQGRRIGLLMAGRRRDLDSIEQSACLLAAQLLGVQLALSQQHHDAMAGVRNLLLAEVLAGRTLAAQHSDDVVWPQVPADPVLLACVAGDPRVLAEIPLADLRVVWGIVEERLWIVLAPAQRQRLAERLRRRALSFSISAPCGWGDLAEVKHATLAGLLGEGSAGQASLLDLLPPRQASAFATATLGPLATAEFSDLLATLGVWLDQNGSVERAAEQLGVHRHTVRRRVQRAATLVGPSVETPQGRHELWFACEVLRRARGGADASGPRPAAG